MRYVQGCVVWSTAGMSCFIAGNPPASWFRVSSIKASCPIGTKPAIETKSGCNKPPLIKTRHRSCGTDSGRITNSQVNLELRLEIWERRSPDWRFIESPFRRMAFPGKATDTPERRWRRIHFSHNEIQKPHLSRGATDGVSKGLFRELAPSHTRELYRFRLLIPRL
jgi:hypothetical protein